MRDTASHNCSSHISKRHIDDIIVRSTPPGQYIIENRQRPGRMEAELVGIQHRPSLLPVRGHWSANHVIPGRRRIVAHVMMNDRRHARRSRNTGPAVLDKAPIFIRAIIACAKRKRVQSGQHIARGETKG